MEWYIFVVLITVCYYWKTKANVKEACSKPGTEPHTHRIWSTSFRLVVTWLAESTDCKGEVGRLSKGREGCLRRVLASPHLLYWTFTKWSIDSCQNRIATDQYHMTSITWPYRGLSVDPLRSSIFWSYQLTSYQFLNDRRLKFNFLNNSYEICRVFLPHN